MFEGNEVVGAERNVGGMKQSALRKKRGKAQSTSDI